MRIVSNKSIFSSLLIPNTISLISVPNSYLQSPHNKPLLRNISNEVNFSLWSQKNTRNIVCREGTSAREEKKISRRVKDCWENDLLASNRSNGRGWRAHALERHLQPLILAYKLENVLSRLREALPRDDTVFRRAARYLLALNDH